MKVKSTGIINQFIVTLDDVQNPDQQEQAKKLIERLLESGEQAEDTDATKTSTLITHDEAQKQVNRTFQKAVIAIQYYINRSPNKSIMIPESDNIYVRGADDKSNVLVEQVYTENGEMIHVKTDNHGGFESGGNRLTEYGTDDVIAILKGVQQNADKNH